MMINVYEPEKPIVIVDRDFYRELKQKAQLNEVELKKQATKMANEIMIKDGIAFTIRINDERKIIKGHEVVRIEEDEYNEWSSWNPKIQNMKFNIAHELISEINKAFRPQREEIIKFFHDYYRKDRLQHKKTRLKLLLINLILWVALAGVLIYVIIK